MFQFLVQFPLKAGIFVLRNNWYFSLNIKAHANKNVSKITTLAKNLFKRTL